MDASTSTNSSNGSNSHAGSTSPGGRVPAEPGRVDVSEIWEREYWMGVFAVTEDQLREAVTEVGNDTEAVKAYFSRTQAHRSAQP